MNFGKFENDFVSKLFDRSQRFKGIIFIRGGRDFYLTDLIIFLY